MGIMPKKSQLGTLEESRLSRNSLHFRGTSHNSALKEKHRPHMRNVSGTDSNSSNDPERAQGTFFRRLSSLPEQRPKPSAFNTSIESAKSLLFSLHSLHPYMGTLLHLASEDGSKRSSLERVFYNSSTQLEALDQSIHIFTENADVDDRQRGQQARNIRRASRACLVAYSQLGKMLIRNSRHLMLNADVRYIRMLLVLIYGSNIEAGNAFQNLGPEADQGAARKHSAPDSASSFRGNVLKLAVPPLAASQERLPTSRRIRHDPSNPLRTNQTPPQMINGKPQPQPQSAVPLYVNGRSRSNSRSSHSNAIANTPRSDSFFMPPTPSYSVADNIIGINQADGTQDVIFERVIKTFQRFVDDAQQAFTKISHDLDLRLERARLNNENKTRLALWSRLAGHALETYDQCRTQSKELAKINLWEPGLRNSVHFWHRVTAAGHSFADFCTHIKKALGDYRGEQALIETHKALNPCFKSFKAATNALENSPWRDALTNISTGANQTSVQTQWQPGGLSNGHSQNRLNGHQRAQGGSGPGSSPYMPTTPLSAALGPAAAATLPSGSGSTDFDRSFQGNVFQRAAYALNSNPHPAFRRA